MNPTTTLLLFFSLILSSCIPLQKGIVTFHQEPDDIFTKEALKLYLVDNPNPKIVLRVPNDGLDITYNGIDVAARPNMLNARVDMYNTIEGELLKSGFDVRDRSLFEAILVKKEATDYKKIKSLTDTDLILELVNLNSNILYETNKYESYKKRKKRIVPQGEIRLLGAVIEFKVILVSTNEIVGTYEFNFSPCTDGCGFYIGQYGQLYRSSSIYGGSVPPYEIVESDALVEFLQAATRELILNLSL